MITESAKTPPPSTEPPSTEPSRENATLSRPGGGELTVVKVDPEKHPKNRRKRTQYAWPSLTLSTATPYPHLNVSQR
jgi:hypothetical protein